MEEDKVLQVENLSFSYGNRKVFKDLSISIRSDRITTIMGANGCGKSTLFNILTKNLSPQNGEVTLNGKKVKDISLKNFAKEVAIVHQQNTVSDDITVEELVRYGRLPYDKYMKSAKEKDIDDKKVEEALKTTGLLELRHQLASSLSGGQRQRAWIAMALAQDTKILFLDEPTTYLDIAYQLQILKLIKELNTLQNTTIVMVLHDINQALAYSHEIIALSPNGEVLAQGDAQEVVTSELLEKMYGVELPITEINGNPFAICV